MVCSFTDKATEGVRTQILPTEEMTKASNLLGNYVLVLPDKLHFVKVNQAFTLRAMSGQHL